MKNLFFNRFIPVFLSCVGLILSGCGEDFLSVTPQGVLDEDVLANEKGIDALLIGAYSMLDGVSDQGYGWESASSNWLFGSVRGMEANRGSGPGDSPDLSQIQNFIETPTHYYLNVKWMALYEGIARANAVLRTVTNAEAAATITPEATLLYRRQARALRGHYHAEAWKLFGTVPFMTENTPLGYPGNQEDIREKIEQDLLEGTLLPDNMGQVGRFNGTVCRVLLAKARMQMNHDYAGALPLLEEVVATGKKPDGSAIGLAPTYGEIFDAANRNGIESIYTIQYSVNDGSGGWNGGWGEVLNFPYKGEGESPAGCCGFFQPAFDFVNSFRTSNGLPLPDGAYNQDPVQNDQGILATNPNFQEDPGTLDPRLDWTVGRRGIPYLDWGEHTGSDWIRNQGFAGPYSPKKQVFRQSQEGVYTETGNWTIGFTANGYRMIRFADVLLLLAECEMETGDLPGALEHVNAVRNRAANPDGFVMESDGVTPAANYQVSLYPAFPNVDYARKALFMERKLELGMEGHRYFDLNRWGITQAEADRFLSFEKPLLPVLYQEAAFSAEDTRYPIPQRQIDLSKGNLIQNR